MHRSITPSLFGSVLLLMAAAALAQTPSHLVGITRIQPVLRHVEHGTCTQLAQCAPNVPDGTALPPTAGGTAWDPVAGGAWVTNGAVLARIADGCELQCPPQLILFTANAHATGLEVVESRRRLLLIDSSGRLHEFGLDCPAPLLGVCDTGLGVGTSFETTGLAADEGLGLLFYGLSDPATGDNVLAVASLHDPCRILQRVPVPRCSSTAVPFGGIRGLAADWCRRVIFATDGRNTMAIRYQPAATAGITIAGANCCAPPVVDIDPMVGLAVRPGGASAFGQSCANGTCPSCPMRHGIGNDPNIGNHGFFLTLDGAPEASLAWAVVGVGPCGPPGLVVPPLCGAIWVHHPLGVLGPALTGGNSGGSACNGLARWRLPIPLIPSLCATTISSQAAVLCSSITGQIGTSLSNCLSFDLQGS